MAKRMISDLVYESDNFLNLPLTAQALYTHLVLQCDNWGFFSSLNTVKRMIGASQNDVDILEQEGFLMRFEGTTTCCLPHWNIMNSMALKGKSDFPEAKLVRKDGGVYVRREETDEDRI